MIQWWIVWRQIQRRRFLFDLNAFLTIAGIAIGVACLVVAMAVVSGYETTLKRSVIDSMGHIIVVDREQAGARDLVTELPQKDSRIKHVLPYAMVEGVLAHKKKVSGVLLEGVEEDSFSKVLNLEKRLVSGKIDFSISGRQSNVLIGNGISKKFDLKVGDVFRMVVPIVDHYDGEKFRSRLIRLKVAGIVELGRHDFNQRYIIGSLRAVRKALQQESLLTGYRLKLDADEIADEIAYNLEENYGSGVWTKTWKGMNRNLFKATQLEKMVIFLVLLIMVIAASVNAASTLYVNVVRKFRDISVLKTLGATRSFVYRIFVIYGIILGLVGVIVGHILGVIICQLFLFLQRTLNVMPAEIYKLDFVAVEFRLFDIAAIVVCTLVICFFATVAPARKGACLTAVEGLKYD